MRVVLKLVVAWTLFTAEAKAFSLLGPYEDWMQETNGFRQAGDIGGPMNLGEEYRWNVPVLTYGFDQAFLDFFGTNGVASVEAAIQVLNSLPPVSTVELTNFPLETKRVNYSALQQDLIELKSATLSVLLEQLGLAQPTRNIFILRRWDQIFQLFPSEQDWWEWAIPYYILERNFDPTTFAPVHYVNGALFSAYVNGNSNQADVIEFKIDPVEPAFPAVAERTLYASEFYNGLSRDDVGGLRYLLRSNNVNFETLPPGARGTGSNCATWADGALRPGVEKITFVPHPYDAQCGRFLPYTNQFLDAYITNNTLIYQQIARRVSEPDMLFCAADIRDGNTVSPFFIRTGTSNWWNSSISNLAGPGVIRPPVRITFNKLTPLAITADWFPDEQAWLYYKRWASFDTSTNTPVAFPDGPSQATNQLNIRFWLHHGTTSKTDFFSWILPVPIGGRAALLASTNLTDWTPIGSISNQGAPVDWHHFRAMERRFLRAVPE